jgi:DNA-directed RNA polymerase specialized sigma24 family protein
MIMTYSSEELKVQFTQLVTQLKRSGVNHHVAEDAAMDALCKQLAMGQKRFNLEAWISRIALNAAFTKGRKKNVAEKHRQMLAQHAARLREEDAFEPWEEAARREESEILAKLVAEALQTLSDLEREILVLHVINAVRIESLVALFRATPGSIRGHLQRARERVRRYLASRLAKHTDNAV